MRRRTRRDADVFSLSFLDCICCGFGAILLLLVLSKTTEPIRLEESREELDAIIAMLEEELYEIFGESRVVNREVEALQEQVSDSKIRLARLQGDLSRIQGRFQASSQDSAVKNLLEGKLATARQELSEEMERLLGEGYRRAPGDETVGGIPVDSEYIIFVIDTSGSMQRYNWSRVLKKLEETLRIYPRVKGIQVLNDMGDYMFSRYAGRWIPDSPARRSAILKRLRTWRPFSNSSPVEGIERAIRTFYAQDKKISIYVFGDEFTGPSISDVVAEVDRLNAKTASGERYVRIHGVGFPIPTSLPTQFQQTGVRFATLMRLLCERNGGTFVGLTR